MSWGVWTKEEEAFLRANLGKLSAAEMSAVLKTKTRESVLGKIWRMRKKERPIIKQAALKPDSFK